MTTTDTVTAFREAVLADDVDALVGLFAPDPTFHSPAVHAAVEGATLVRAYLTAAGRTFEDFRYLDELSRPATGEGGVARAVLVFAASVGDRELEGIDLLTIDAAGRITDLTVMIRPLRGLEAVIVRMGEELQRLLDTP